MKIWIWLLFFIPIASGAQSIEVSNGRSFGATYLGGKVLIHTPKIYLKSPTYSQAVELSYKKQTMGKSQWEQKFGFPEVALNLSLASSGSQQIGNAVGIYPSILFKILNSKNYRSYWFVKVGGGVGIISKHWQRTPSSDSFNNIIGSTVNNFTMIQTGFCFPINKHITLQTALHFYHISNAAARTPNYGINTMGINLGVNYFPQGVVSDIRNFKKVYPKSKNALNVSTYASLAFAEDKTVNGPLYPISTYALSLYKMYRSKSRVYAGFNAIYNAKSYAIIRNSFQTEINTKFKTIQYDVFIGNEFLFGRIGLPLQIGYYLNRPLGGKRYYEKLGMNYHFYHNNSNAVKDLFISLLLKTHISQAQHAELGLGMLF